MSREMNRIRNAVGGATLLAVLALGLGCAGGVDEDRQRTPGFVPPDNSPTVGRITLDLDDPDNRIPADGTTIVEAVAIVTDAQGRPLVDTFVIFTSEFEDVTWLTAQRLPPFNLSPGGFFGFAVNECGEFTNSDGRASCLMRSSFEQGSTQLRAEAVDLRLRATEDIEFTFSGGGPGLSLALACGDGASTTILAEELPTSERIRVTVTQSDIGVSRPGAGVDVFLSTSNGQFENGRDEITLRTDSLGVATVDLRFSTSSRDTTATVLAATSGSLPNSCTFTIADFTAPATTLSSVPGEVTAQNPGDQVIAVAVQLSPPPAAANSTVSFASPIGSFAPNPAAVAGGSGFAETLWTISAAESAQLVAGSDVPIVFSVDFGALLPSSGSESLPVVDFVRSGEEGDESEEEEPVEVTE